MTSRSTASPFGFDVGHQLGRRVLLRQVDGDGARVAELLRQRFEPVLAPRGQHKAMAALRQLARELDPEAGRRAGDRARPASCTSRASAMSRRRLDDLAGLARRLAVGKASTCSMPLSTSPHTVYWPSRKRRILECTMKNWLLALFGFCERAIEAIAALVRLARELGLEVRQVGAVVAGPGRVAALRHEAGDHAVEDDAVVKAAVGELGDARDVARREVGAELDDDVAAGGKGKVQAVGVGHGSNSM